MVKKNRVHAKRRAYRKNRVLPPGIILLGFLRGWPVGYAISLAATNGPVGAAARKLAVTARTYLNDDKKAQRLRKNLSGLLLDLVQGKNLDTVSDEINKYTLRRPDLIFWKEGEHKINVPYRTFQHHGKIVLNAVSCDVISAGHGSIGAHQFFFSILRSMIENGTVQRFKLCPHCNDVFYRKSMKGIFCGDRCRWTTANHSPSRQQKRIKGVWIR